MKRIFLACSLLAFPAFGMDMPIQTFDQMYGLPIEKQQANLSIENYINKRKLMFGMAQIFCADKEAHSQESSEDCDVEEVQVNSSPETLQKVVTIFIDALKLDECLLTIGTSQVKLKEICFTEKFKRLLTLLVNENLERGSQKTDYVKTFLSCIKWKSLKKNLHEADYKALQSVVDTSSGKELVVKNNVPLLDRLDTLTTLFLGFKLTEYFDSSRLEGALQTASSREMKLTIFRVLSCLNIRPFLERINNIPGMRIDQERINRLQKALMGYFALLHDLTTPNRGHNAVEQFLSFLEQYADKGLSLENTPQVKLLTDTPLINK